MHVCVDLQQHKQRLLRTLAPYPLSSNVVDSDSAEQCARGIPVHHTLIHAHVKVMPFSTGLSTTLSNFEAGLNYKDVSDPSVMVKFPIIGDPDGAAFIAWTTTPWPLPSNLALCVHPEFTYARVKDPSSGAVYIVAESRLATVPGAVPKKGKGKKGMFPPATALLFV